MEKRPAQVVFITRASLTEGPGGLYSPIASVRREIILPARVLAQRGIGVDVASLRQWPADRVRGMVERADRIVFGKLLADPSESSETVYRANAAAYRAVLDAVAEERHCVFCFADDHFNAPAFAQFYRDAAAASRAWVTSSDVLKERLQAQARCPVRVYQEIAETRRARAHTPRRRWRERAAVWAARRLGLGLEAWRVRLLWFGHPTNLPPLLATMDELRALAEQVPLHLECVTQPGAALQTIATPPNAAADSPLRVTVTPWSLESMQDALEACDAVILPQALDHPRKRAKSNNRLVDSLNAGRFVVAHPLPSYAPLAEYAWLGDSIAAGLRWMLGHPHQAIARLVAGQHYIARHHSEDALAQFWLAALEL